MLELINEARTDAGLNPVVLSDNIAAQLHADAALANCFSSHWGIDGLKPYMRYTLTGGYQSNAENVSGLDYCIREADGYVANSSIEEELRKTMDGFMSSPGHRRNILGKAHKKVSIGLAWDEYNFTVIQNFEGCYVEYDELPVIIDWELAFSGRVTDEVHFVDKQDLGVGIYYDPPPHSLTRGQVARTYCYDGGRIVAHIRPWPGIGRSYLTYTDIASYSPCPDPYDVPADAAAPSSYSEAHAFWEQAYAASQNQQEQEITFPWITASEWTAKGKRFSVKTGIGSVLDKHGAGVYTVRLWGPVNGEYEIISEYSIFYAVEPPSGYTSR